jgi:lactate dehydrogenase-like 2-hydroxyacid dehydrogenase
MTKEIVLVTEPEFRKAEAAFREVADWQLEPAPPQEQALAAAVRTRSARAVIVGIEKYQGPLYEALADTGGKRGALVARFGVGHDGIDKPLARQHNIVVTNTPGALDISVAEHTLWLIGNLVRHVSVLEAAFRAGEFAPRPGTEVQGKTLGIVGFGHIGRRVAKIAHFGFGMDVLALGSRSSTELEDDEKRPLKELLAEHGARVYTDNLADVLQQSDIVSLHLPSNSQTRHLVNAERLKLFKPSALLVNTARGAVVDEAALYDALSDGRLAGAGLDVFEAEPYRPAAPDKDLRTLASVVLTPHVGSNTAEANRRMAQACLESLAQFFAGTWDQLPRVDLPKA